MDAFHCYVCVYEETLPWHCSHLSLQKCISERILLVLHLANLVVIVVFPCVIILLGQPSPCEGRHTTGCTYAQNPFPTVLYTCITWWWQCVTASVFVCL